MTNPRFGASAGGISEIVPPAALTNFTIRKFSDSLIHERNQQQMTAKKKPGMAKGTKMRPRATSGFGATAATIEMIARYCALQAKGKPEKEIAAELDVSWHTLKTLRTRYPDIYRPKLAEAMTAAAAEVRAIAGTPAILAIPADYMRTATTLDAYMRETYGNSLFPVPTAEQIKLGAEHTLSSFYENYYLPVCASNSSQESITLYRLILRRWALLTGDPPLSKIDSSLLALFRDAQAAMPGRRAHLKSSVNTVRMYLTHLQAIIDKAGPPDRRNRLAAGLIPQAPYVKKPQAEFKEARIVPEQLINDCYMAAVAMSTPQIDGFKPPAWWRALLVLVWNTGLRYRTVFGLRMSHVDWENSRLVIPKEITKGRKKIILPLNETTLEHLRAIRTKRDFLFPWPGVREWFRKQFKKLQKEAGIPPLMQFGLHAIRRTVATRLWKQSPQAAQLMMGHSSLIITQQHYVNDSEVIREVMDGTKQPDAFGRQVQLAN